MKQSSKKLWYLILVVILATLAWVVWSSNTKQTMPENTRTIARGTITQEVSITGRVKPIASFDLSFEKNGRIQNVFTAVGDRIKKGTLLAEVESSAAQATVMEASARLAELRRGSRPEEIAVKEAEIAKYNQDLTNSYDGVVDTINDAFTKSDEALHVKMTGIFSGFQTSSYKFSYQICDSQIELDASFARQTSEIDFDLWREERAKMSPSPSYQELALALDQAKVHLEKLKTFLDKTNRTLTLDCTVSNTNLDTYRANLNTARNNITSSLSAINTKKQTIASSTLALAKVKNELSLLTAGTASEVISAQAARLENAESELKKHRIYAPQDGIVTAVNAKVGEPANTTSIFLNLISDTSFEITANVPESDIAKIKIGKEASVTLDAYGSEVVFKSRVISIDPRETIIDNVPTYKVTLHFSENDQRIKSGMTANIEIITATRENILVAPQRAIVAKDGKKMLSVVNTDGTTHDIIITTGLRGSDGMTEILSGATEGMLILATPK